MQRTSRWDAVPEHGATAEVVYQKGRITASGHTTERSIYRQQIAKAAHSANQPSMEEEQVRPKLEATGVDWGKPLSARGYKEWHDRSPRIADSVATKDSALLVLTSVPESGPVARETLSVRKTDFHAVGRSIEYRGGETIEIAELSYALTPLSEVPAGVFGAISSATLSRTTDRVTWHPPAIPLYESELDSAELATRLALIDLHEEENGRLRLIREGTGIRIEGIVETEEQKRRIETRLRQVRHTAVAVVSISEMAAQPRGPQRPIILHQSSDVAEPSALERFLEAANRPSAMAAQLPQDLLNSSISANRHRLAIAELMRRFSSDQSMDKATELALDALLTVERQKLLAALRDEEEALVATHIYFDQAETSRLAGEIRSAGERNFMLCRQIAAGKVGDDTFDVRLAAMEIEENIRLLQSLALHLPNAASATDATNQNQINK